MYSTFLALALAILFMDSAVLVRAGLYIVNPFQGSTCQAGVPCTVTWLDDGIRPLLSAIGVSTVGLYTGKQQLVQTLSPTDVSTAHSLTFVPKAAAGPNSDTYYIAITSTTLKNGSSLYSGWSPFFTLTGMTGSFETPLPAATSTTPVPASLTTARNSTTVISTITVGAISTTIKSHSHSSAVTKSASSAPAASSSAAASSSSPLSVSSSPAASSATAVSSSATGSSSRLSTSVSPSATPASTSAASTTPSPSALSANTSSNSGSLLGASRLPPPAVLALAIFSASLLRFS